MWHRLLTLTGLYVAQGMPFGFFVQSLPVLLRQRGYSLAKIGASSMLAVPWALKFLWAPFVDRYGSTRHGRRKSWIVPLQIASAALLIYTGASSPTLRTLMVIVFLTNLLTATQDVATDGLAVDLLPPHERGWANGIQVGGYRLGMILGGGVLLMLLDIIGWSISFYGMAGLLLLALVPLLLFREHSQSPPSVASPIKLLRYVSDPSWRYRLALVALYKVGDNFSTGMLRPFLVDQGLGLKQLGLMLGTIGSVFGLLGAGIGGLTINRIGRQRALLYYSAAQAIVGAVYAYASYVAVHAPPSASLLYGMTAAEHLFSSMATTALFTCMMDWCRPISGATDYTVQASIVVICTGVASAVAGLSAQAFGYFGHFILGAAITAATTVLIPHLYRKAATI